MKKKRLKRELRALAQRQEQLEEAQRRLTAYTEVIAVAIRTPERVPQRDLDTAIAAMHELNGINGRHPEYMLGWRRRAALASRDAAHSQEERKSSGRVGPGLAEVGGAVSLTWL
jgi:hypothetical protein